MPPFAFQIEKSVPWRGETQHFGNVYHYDLADTSDDALNTVLNALEAAEKKIHSAGITFQRARAWGPTNQGPLASNMRVVRALTGTGATVHNDAMYREIAFMCFWPLGRYGNPARPQFLRKWLHCMYDHGITLSEVLAGNQAIGATPALLADYIATVTNIVTGVTICTSAGRVPTGPGQLYPYIEHRQLGK